MPIDYGMYLTIGLSVRTLRVSQRKVLHVTEGKGKDCIKAIKTYLESKGVKISKIAHASIDLSSAFISGIHEHLPEAEIYFDRFHVVKLLNEAMNSVQTLERKEHEELKDRKYTFLKNRESLLIQKAQELSDLIALFPTLGQAYRLKELFNDFWEMKSEEEVVAFLVDWCEEVNKSGIEAFKKFSSTIKTH